MISHDRAIRLDLVHALNATDIEGSFICSTRFVDWMR